MRTQSGPESDRIRVFIRRDTREFSLSLLHPLPFSLSLSHPLSPHPSTPLSLSLRRVRTLKEGSRLQARERALTRTKPCFQTSNFQNYKKINPCCLSHSLFGILFWQPKQTKIGSTDVGWKNPFLYRTILYAVEYLVWSPAMKHWQCYSVTMTTKMCSYRTPNTPQWGIVMFLIENHKRKL